MEFVSESMNTKYAYMLVTLALFCVNTFWLNILVDRTRGNREIFV